MTRTQTTAFWTNDKRDMSTIALTPGGEPLKTYWNEDGIMCVKDPCTDEELQIVYA